MSEHPLNAISAAVLERASDVMTATGDLSAAIREAVIAAHEEVELNFGGPDDPGFMKNVLNALYVVGRPLVRLEARHGG